MATWLNLGIVGDLASEDHNRETGHHGTRLEITKAALFDDEGRPLTAMFSSVSRQSALGHIARLGMRAFDPPRVLLCIKEPFSGEQFIPIFGPLETDEVCWPHAAIARLKASGRF